jgi:hypothetical protein
MISKIGLNQEKGSNNVEFLGQDIRNIMPIQQKEEIKIKESENIGTLNTPEGNTTVTNIPTDIGFGIQPPQIFGTPVEEKEEKSSSFFKTKREKIVFFAFIIPPLAISLISMMHLITLFATSNSYAMAVAISVSIELASMSSLVALVTLNKLNKTTIWSIFMILALLQIIGNCYHAYINMSPESLKSILDLFALNSSPWSLRFVMFMISGILPVISLSFIKGLVDYFKEEKNDN